MASLQASTLLISPSSLAKSLTHGQGLFRRQGINAAIRLRHAHRLRGLNRSLKPSRKILADCGQQKS